MLLRFTIGGKDLDMGNTKIKYYRKNPMFEDIGSHTLPFKFIRNSHNDDILKISHPGSFLGYEKLDAVLHIGPVQVKGEFYRTESSDTYHEGYFTSGISSFREIVKEVKITEIDYEEIIYDSGTGRFIDALTTAAFSSYPTHNYTCFPMLCPQYFEGITFSYNGTINPWSYDSGVNGRFYPYESIYNSYYAPSFYLNFVIKKVFDNYGYLIEYNDLYEDTELRTLVIPNFNCKGVIDDWYSAYNLKFSEALPPVLINDMITALENMFNVTFFINELSKSVVIRKNTPIVKSLPEKEIKLVSRKISFDKKPDGVSLNYEMPFEDPFAQISDISKYTVSLMVDSIPDLELSANAPENYKNQLAFVTNNDYYYLSKIIDAVAETYEWVPLTQNFFEYKTGKGEMQVITQASPILMDNEEIFEYIDAFTGIAEFGLFPRVDLSLFNSDGNQEFKTFSTLRLLFYRGVVAGGGKTSDPSEVNSDQPLASSDVYRAQGIAGSPPKFGRVKIASANQSLKWNGTYGLYVTNWKDYLYWLFNIKKDATDYYELSISDIFNIKFWEKYKAGDASVIFRTLEIELDFGKDRITSGKCEVYLS